MYVRAQEDQLRLIEIKNWQFQVDYIECVYVHAQEDQLRLIEIKNWQFQVDYIECVYIHAQEDQLRLIDYFEQCCGNIHDMNKDIDNYSCKR